MFVFLGLTLLGLPIVRAQDEAKDYFDRAMTVREGMTIDEVRATLGDPKIDEAATTETVGSCPAGTARVMSYWYEHEWLWWRLSSASVFVPLCVDQQGKVIAVGMDQSPFRRTHTVRKEQLLEPPGGGSGHLNGNEVPLLRR